MYKRCAYKKHVVFYFLSLLFQRELNITTKDDIHHYSPVHNTKAVAGNFRQLFWTETNNYGSGISYNKYTHSGYVVMLFDKGFTDDHKLDSELPHTIGMLLCLFYIIEYIHSTFQLAIPSGIEASAR